MEMHTQTHESACGTKVKVLFSIKADASISMTCDMFLLSDLTGMTKHDYRKFSVLLPAASVLSAVTISQNGNTVAAWGIEGGVVRYKMKIY